MSYKKDMMKSPLKKGEREPFREGRLLYELYHGGSANGTLASEGLSLILQYDLSGVLDGSLHFTLETESLCQLIHPNLRRDMPYI